MSLLQKLYDYYALPKQDDPVLEIVKTLFDKHPENITISGSAVYEHVKELKFKNYKCQANNINFIIIKTRSTKKLIDELILKFDALNIDMSMVPTKKYVDDRLLGKSSNTSIEVVSNYHSRESFTYELRKYIKTVNQDIYEIKLGDSQEKTSLKFTIYELDSYYVSMRDDHRDTPLDLIIQSFDIVNSMFTSDIYGNIDDSIYEKFAEKDAHLLTICLNTMYLYSKFSNSPSVEDDMSEDQIPIATQSRLLVKLKTRVKKYIDRNKSIIDFNTPRISNNSITLISSVFEIFLYGLNMLETLSYIVDIAIEDKKRLRIAEPTESDKLEVLNDTKKYIKNILESHDSKKVFK